MLFARCNGGAHVSSTSVALAVAEAGWRCGLRARVWKSAWSMFPRGLPSAALPEGCVLCIFHPYPRDDTPTTHIPAPPSPKLLYLACRCFVSPCLVDAVNHGSRKKRTVSPLSTSTNLCCFLMRPLYEGSMDEPQLASIARRSEIGVGKTRFGRRSPKVWLTMIST